MRELSGNRKQVYDHTLRMLTDAGLSSVDAELWALERARFSNRRANANRNAIQESDNE